MTSARTVVLQPAAAFLPCRIDVPAHFEAPARYAVEELLRPLGLRPEWEPAGNAPGGLWYGTSSGTAPEGWLAIRMAGETASFFRAPRAIGPEDVAWRTSEGRRIPVLFTQGANGTPDPVATAFFWLSGLQERLATVRDRHGRFSGADSLQAALGIDLDAPVDDARDVLEDALRRAGVALFPRRWSGRPWALCPTFDVDYTRKWRPGIVWRETVQYLLLNRRGVPAARRLDRFGGALRDMLRPGDPFREAMDRIPEELARVGAGSTWFLKTGAHGPHDVGYRLRSRWLRGWVSRLLDAGHEIGLHPSYHAFAHAGYMERERDRLGRLLGSAPEAVRMHFLRWQDPDTARLAERLAFRIDSTLGFADRPGFRHGTTLPFHPWDERAGGPSGLWEMPLAVMESALFNRCGMNLRQAIERTEGLAETARRHGGALVALWHTTLWDEVDCPGWGDHFLRTLGAAVERGAAVPALSDALSTWAPGPG
jgi:hypothetical protein